MIKRYWAPWVRDVQELRGVETLQVHRGLHPGGSIVRGLLPDCDSDGFQAARSDESLWS